MNNDELDSQLSAMFDDELPAPECELLARRLARDEALKARWGRYAAIGAAIRMERGILSKGGLSGLAVRISTAVQAEPALLVGAAQTGTDRLVSPGWSRWWQPVAGTAVAAGVAVAAILWLRNGSPDTPVVAQSTATSAPAVHLNVGTAGPTDASDSYVIPPPAENASYAPPTELADFVVAHSEFSAPLLRRSALAALAAESASDSADARNVERAGASEESRNSHADSSR